MGKGKKAGGLGSISMVIALLLAAAVIFVFLRNFTFGFLPLMIILGLFLWVIGVTVCGYNKSGTMSLAKTLSAFLVLIFGTLCLVALNNYVNPSRAVFANNDHHAIAVEGLHLRDTKGLRLAGNSPDAIFDNGNFIGGISLGSARIKTSPDDTVKIVPFNKKGFSTPVYARQKETSYKFGIPLKWFQKTERYFRDIDENAVDVFSSGDEVILTQEGISVSFTVTEREDSAGSAYTLKYVRDSVEVVETSPFTTYVGRSYPLAAMFRNVEIPDIDLSGITLYRTVFFDTKVDNAKKRYAQLGAKYRLALEGDADTGTEIQVRKTGTKVVPAKETKNFEFLADGTTVYAIGTNEAAVRQFRLYPEKEGVSLRFRMPGYRYLSADCEREKAASEELSFLLATTILLPDGSVNQFVPENILLFDEFDHSDNIHQMKPVFLSFVSGATNDALKLSLFSADGNMIASGLEAGNRFPEIPSAGNKSAWIVSLDNFKNPDLVRPGEIGRPMNPRTMALIIIIVTIVSVLLLTSGRVCSYVEPMAYLVLLGFLTVRLFLLWRISVFPPLTSISVSEFNGIFREPSSFTGFFTGGSVLAWIIRLLTFFYAAIFAVKVFGVRKGSKLMNWLGNDSPARDDKTLKRRFIILVAVIPILFAAGGIGLKLAHVSSRVACVLLPLVIYFVTDFISNRIFGGDYFDKKDDVDKRYLWVLITNSAAATIYCFVMDGGFGIIFFIFSILNVIMRLLDARLKKNWALWMLPILSIAFLAFSKNFLLLMMEGKTFAIVLFLTLSTVYILLLLAFRVIRFEDKKPVFDKKVVIALGAGMSIIILLSAASLLAPKLFEGTHIYYRMLVQQEEPGRALGKMSSVTAERKLMEASVNDWIIGEYATRGKAVSAFVGEHGHGYLKIQPQSKVGALWGAQTTDISLSRYVIAEHGRLLAVMLVAILGLMMIFCVNFFSTRIWSKALITQIPLLFFVQALLVWMAVTQRFIFLGQDFPMISITSKLTLFVFIGLMAVMVVAATIEYATVRNLKDDAWRDREEEKKIEKRNKVLQKQIFIYYTIAFAMLILMGNQREYQFYSPLNRKESATRYDVERCMLALEESLKKQNEAFGKFQQEHMDKINAVKPRRRRRKDISISFSTPYQAIRAYCSHCGYDPDAADTANVHNPISQCFGAAGEEYKGFCKMAFDRFLKTGAEKNDINGLIFIVKNKAKIDGVLNVEYELMANDEYYSRELPRNIRDSWKGSIVHKSQQDDKIPPVAVEQGYTVYTLPEEWTGSEEPVRLVKSSARSMMVVGKTRPVVLGKGESALLSETDNVMVDGRNADFSKYGNVSYLAKHVMINGSASFIYPLQDKLFWVRPFSDGVRSDMADTKAKDGKDTDIYLSLSTRLSSTLYDVVSRARPELATSAIVADGDGRIVAMVDRKEKKYRINPNDSRQIVRIENELKLEGEYRREAQNYFGNKAMNNLRYGPGSSQKPLVWTAVTTQYNDPDFWENLKFAKLNTKLVEMSDAGHFSTHYIAGTKLSKGAKNRSTGKYSYFQSIAGDEGGGVSDVTLSSYIYKSSNYYNAVMAFIGSYPYDTLRQALSAGDTTLLRKLPRDITTTGRMSDSTLYRESFPIIQLGNRAPMAFKSIPSEKTIDDRGKNGYERSVLIRGLDENLGLPSENDRAFRPVIYDYATERVKRKSGLAYPDVSYFCNEHRADENDRARADNAIRYTAIGGASVWQVSPLAMARMYGKMISLDKNFSLSLMPSQDNEYERFDIDNVPDTYDNIGSYYGIRSIFTDGLSQVFSNKGGTGHGVFSLLKADGYVKNAEKAQMTATASDGTSTRTLYFYGKTGTTNGTDAERKPHTDHLLAVVITDRDVTTLKSTEDYKEMKFYVLYMADFDNAGWVASDAAIINAVLSSQEFKSYMDIKY